MDINQSLVKRTSKTYCPKKLKAELDGLYKRPASLPMIKGQYFEYKLFGTKNREGQVPELPLKRNGEMTVDQIRIDRQVKIFDEICKKHDIKVYGMDRAFKLKMFDHNTHGIWDAYGLYRGRPSVIDIKLTKDVNNDFGDFSWGDFDVMDKIQAYTYMEAGKRMDGVNYDFLFMVFDYQPDPQYALYEVKYDSSVPLMVQQRFDEAKEKLVMNNADGWLAFGVAEDCSVQRNGKAVGNCPFADSCPSFTSKKERKTAWERVKAKKLINQSTLVESQKEVEDIFTSVFN